MIEYSDNPSEIQVLINPSPETGKNMFEKIKGSAQKKFGRANDFISYAAKKTGKFASAASQGAKEIIAGTAISEATNLKRAKSAAKYASGVKGYKEIKAARQIKKLAERKITAATKATEIRKTILNKELESYAENKINVLKNTIFVFVEYLSVIGQKNRGCEYEALKSIDVKIEDIPEIRSVGLSGANLAKGVTESAALGTMALFGTKALVSKGIVVFASTSTGAAISSLSVVAATNAALAFLGGGTLSSGTGGVAAGTVVLGGITAGAFAGVAALTGGILLSAHGSNALTRVKTYSTDVDEAIAILEKSWVIMDGIRERVNELKDLILKLEHRAVDELKELESLVPIFEPDNLLHKKVFQKTALSMKSIGEVANTQILDENGNISDDSGMIVVKIRSVLST